MSDLRVLVCGGRDYSDRERVFRVLDRVLQERGVAAVIHGAASGADSLAGEWARARTVQERRFPADWTTHGRATGPLRNRQMLTEGKPDGVIAFPGGRGTADMIRAAEAAGLKVWKVPA